MKSFHGHVDAGPPGCVCQDTGVKTLRENHAHTPNRATLQHTWVDPAAVLL